MTSLNVNSFKPLPIAGFGTRGRSFLRASGKVLFNSNRLLKKTDPSLPAGKRESRMLLKDWIPVFAGMKP
jgi:hypothetical protein